MTNYDIAEKAGVSASTVSRVINGKPGIRDATRQKVLALLEEYHYSPNTAARGLATQSSHFIGILIEDIRVSHHTDAVWTIEQEMMRAGYTCITLSTGTTPEGKAQAIQILQQRAVDGVILIGSMFSLDCVRTSILKYLFNTPVVMINGQIDLLNVYSILIDEERGMEACTAAMLEKGCSHPVLLISTDTPSNRSKLEGFRSAIQKSGRTFDASCVFNTTADSMDPLAGMREADEMCGRILEEKPDTDCIICIDDILAVGVLHGLSRRGKSVPGDISVTGMDNTLYGRVSTPTLTSIDNKIEEAGITAARKLLSVLAGNEEPRTVIIPTELIRRDSA
ncbi:MAG: LacI family DNA-binding transcriptional regulator [Lachnospiraceae bacterium]|nr:LacI family DNA-binding transcriptional regulator [Lachnospiraceae bacterium]